MLDHPSTSHESATVAARRAQVASTASALRDRLSPDRLIADGADSVTRVAGQALKGATGLLQRNPGAVALTIAGLAWLALGTRDGDAEEPGFAAVSRWEDEGGNPHPEYDSAVEELGHSGLDTARTAEGLFHRAGQAVKDYPFPLGMVAVALGGILAARLPATQIEQAMVADAKEQLREQARRFMDEGRDRVQTAATDLKDSLRDDLNHAKQHVAEAVDQVTRPAD